MSALNCARWLKLSAQDTCKIVETSVQESKPVIVVAMQYRLNIFAFGDGNSPRNLALKDQRLAIDWVKKHIAGFGGDPVRAVSRRSGQH